MKRSLKNFDPDKIADLDLRMWRAYYDHRFFSLFVLLIRLNHQFFRFSPLSTVKAAFYSASAAIDFRLNRGHENMERISRKLTHFFKVVSNNSAEHFDPRKAAELELNWWLVDRYPDRYQVSRGEALAMAMANLYDVNPSRLAEFGRYGAEAMALRDQARSEGKAVDWSGIESMLKKAFRSLYVNVQ